MNMTEIFERVRELNPRENPEYKDFSDISRGRLFADTFREACRFNVTAKSWYYYEGGIWKPDTGATLVKKQAMRFARAVERYMYENADSPDEAPTKADEFFQEQALKLKSNRTRKTILDDAAAIHPISREDLDKDEDLLCCLNCVVNLKTFEALPHNPDFLLSKQAAVNYDPKADSREWKKFFSEVMCNDREKAWYLQKLLGLSLTAETNREELYILYGKTTRNGKSTCLETFGKLLGDYAISAAPETLAITNKSKDGSAPSPDLARLSGKRFLRVPEPPKNMILNVELVKTMTGGDQITARFLQENPFNFYPRYKLFINTNHLPRIMDQSLFDSGRVNVITFDRHFEPAEQDHELKHRLQSPENLSGLLNWCLEGLKGYRKEGLRPPDTVGAATAEYRDHSDKLGLFMSEELEYDPGARLHAGQVYEKYRSWCYDNGYSPEAKGTFFKILRERDLLTNAKVNGVPDKNTMLDYRFVDEFPTQRSRFF